MAKITFTEAQQEEMLDNWYFYKCPMCGEDKAHEVCNDPERESDYASSQYLTREMHCVGCGADYQVQFIANALVVNGQEIPVTY